MQHLLHHVSYHLDFHDNCKFCRRNRYKTYAETRTEFEHDVKKQSDFLKSVCPHCDSKFCEPHFRKKHIQFEHGQVLIAVMIVPNSSTLSKHKSIIILFIMSLLSTVKYVLHVRRNSQLRLILTIMSSMCILK